MVPLLLVFVSLTVDSKVDSVVVYPDQVLVVRTASVSVSGPGQLVFPGLPGALHDNTVRVKAPGIEIGEVQVVQGYLDEPTPAVRRFKQRVEELEDDLRALADEDAVLVVEEEFLKSIKLGAPELISKELQQGKVSIQSWQGALSFMARELTRVKTRKVKLDRERKAVEELLQAARQEHSDARAAIENRKEVRLDFQAGAGTYWVRMSYVIGYGASWTPYYELRARPDQGDVGLAYFARLEQRTGEDWTRVKVVLSTSRPMMGVSAPTPIPWTVSLVDEYAWARESAQSEAMSSAGFVGGSEKKSYDVDETAVAVVETGISLQYVIPGRVSLESGETAKKLALTEQSLPTEFGYYTLPRVRPQAFLTGRLVNATEFVLLAGNGNTYVGDEFTGSTYLQAVAPGETTEVSFGVDERVRVSRELVKTFRSKSGFFSKSENDRLVFQTVVENYHPKPIEIEIVEQVPVSTQREISVKVHKVEPKPAERDKDAGTCSWRVNLEPRARFVIDLDFTVTHPPVSGTGSSSPRMRLEGLF